MARAMCLTKLVFILLQTLLFLHGVLCVALPSDIARSDSPTVNDIAQTGPAAVVYAAATSMSPHPAAQPSDSDPVATSSHPITVFSGIGIGISISIVSAALYIVKKRSLKPESADDVENGEAVPTPTNEDQDQQGDGKSKKRNRNKLKKKRSTKADADSTDTDETSTTSEPSEPGNVTNEATICKCPSGSISPDETTSIDGIPFTSSGSAYRDPQHKHDTSIASDPFADPKLPELGLTSTPRHSNTDVSSIFASLTPGAQLETISPSPSTKYAAREQFMLQVKAYITKCEDKVKAMDEQREKNRAAMKQRINGQMGKEARAFESRKSPSYLSRITPFQQNHTLEKFRALTPIDFDTKMRYYAHTSIPDTYMNRAGLLNTLLPRIVEGRSYVEQMGGVNSKIWLVIDGLADGVIESGSLEKATSVDNVQNKTGSRDSSVEMSLTRKMVNGQPQVPARNEHATTTPSHLEVSPISSQLSTPALVFSPASPTPSATDSDSMPPTPSPHNGTHDTAFQVSMDKPDDQQHALTLAPTRSAYEGFGLGLRVVTEGSHALAMTSAATTTTKRDTCGDTTSGSSGSAGNATFHSISLDIVVSTSSTSSGSSRRSKRKRFVDAISRFGSKLAASAVPRRSRRSSAASSAQLDDPVPNASDVDVESGLAPGLDSASSTTRKGRNRMFQVFSRAE